MRSPYRPPSSEEAVSYILVGLFTLVVWGIAAYVWYQAYLWYEFVAPITFLITFLVLPVPYWLYQSFRQANTGAVTPASPTAAPGRERAAAPPGLGSWYSDWLIWLGNGETHRGTLVLLVLVFWSILYWSWPNIQLTAFNFAIYGLATIFGMVIIRSVFFRQTNLPGEEVPSASGEAKKSRR